MGESDLHERRTEVPPEMKMLVTSEARLAMLGAIKNLGIDLPPTIEQGEMSPATPPPDVREQGEMSPPPEAREQGETERLPARVATRRTDENSADEKTETTALQEAGEPAPRRSKRIARRRKRVAQRRKRVARCRAHDEPQSP